jgi:hypothetical protein
VQSGRDGGELLKVAFLDPKAGTGFVPPARARLCSGDGRCSCEGAAS